MRKCKTRRIYFIQNGDGGHIKIGLSLDPASRVAAIQHASPFIIQLLWHTEGTPQDEKRVHAYLAAHRFRSEWFNPTPEVLAVASGEDQRWRSAAPEPPPWCLVRKQRRLATLEAKAELAAGHVSGIDSQPAAALPTPDRSPKPRDYRARRQWQDAARARGELPECGRDACRRLADPAYLHHHTPFLYCEGCATEINYYAQAGVWPCRPEVPRV